MTAISVNGRSVEAGAALELEDLPNVWEGVLSEVEQSRKREGGE